MGVSTRELNIGGGFGIRYVEEDESKPLEFFVDAIMESIIQGCENANIDVPLIMIEPGRWIVGGSRDDYLYTIGSIKEIPGIRTYISVDGGCRIILALHCIRLNTELLSQIRWDKN